MSSDFRRLVRKQLRKAASELVCLSATAQGLDSAILEAKMKDFGLRYVSLFGLLVEENKKGGE